MEILSPDDAAVEVWAKIREYLAFGVAYVWVVDPTSGEGEIHSADGAERVKNGRFRAGPIQLICGISDRSLFHSKRRQPGHLRAFLAAIPCQKHHKRGREQPYESVSHRSK